MKRVTRLKSYEITYEPTVEVAQRLSDPYDVWSQDNAYPECVYTSIYTRDGSNVKSMIVEALTKETAKAMFAIHLHWHVMSLSIEGGPMPYVFDGIRNIKSIEEVKNEE